MNERASAQEFTALLDYLKRNRGFDFSSYKHASLMRRINKRMNSLGMSSYIDYLDYLEVQPEEFVYLFNTILINVTSFFRDPQSWTYLAANILPRIINNKKSGEPIRIWSTGCSSGEEAFSIAMLLCEAMGEESFREQVKIYATDIDEESLNRARQAIFTLKEVDGVPDNLLERYFTRNGAHFHFKKDLRRYIIFGRNDLIQDAPISRIDLLICRNTLMYFNTETQGKILSSFHFALNDLGYLFLGKAEMLLTHANIFSPEEVRHRVFSKVYKTNMRDRLGVLAQHNQIENNVNNPPNQAQFREATFENSPIAQIVIDRDQILVMMNNAARQLFRLNLMDLGRPLHDLEISYRPVELRSLIERALADRLPILNKEVLWHARPGETYYLDVLVQPASIESSNPSGVIISFTDVTQQTHTQRALEQTNNELESALEELQSTNEELETMNEELQSTIEELETTNEELQSTNEELETMNEELQSTNSELETINDELQQRSALLRQVNTLNENILTNIQDGVVVLDPDLHIQVWNQKCEDLWGLRSGEVTGKNILNLDIGLPVEKLRKPLLACLNDGSCLSLNLEARNRRGRQIRCHIKTAPLKNEDSHIQGIIVTMEDEEMGG